jgi:hypothetical protein
LSGDNTELIEALQSQQNNTPPKTKNGGQKKHKTIRKHKNKRKTVRHKK